MAGNKLRLLFPGMWPEITGNKPEISRGSEKRKSEQLYGFILTDFFVVFEFQNYWDVVEHRLQRRHNALSL